MIFLSHFTSHNQSLTNINNIFKANDLYNGINIMSYTNINNPFIIPSDGYITTTARNNDYIRVTVFNSNPNNYISCNSLGNDYTGMIQSIFVKKGMKAYVSDVNSGKNTLAIFSPIV